jgi:hypothetical protein
MELFAFFLSSFGPKQLSDYRSFFLGSLNGIKTDVFANFLGKKEKNFFFQFLSSKKSKFVIDEQVHFEATIQVMLTLANNQINEINEYKRKILIEDLKHHKGNFLLLSS